MTTVWVALGDYSVSEFLGVYSTADLAKAAVEANAYTADPPDWEHDDDDDSWWWQREQATVFPHEVDS